MRKRLKSLECLSVVASCEFANRCGFSTHPDLLLARSHKLFNGSRCQCERLRSAEADARKRSPAGLLRRAVAIAAGVCFEWPTEATR